MILSQHEKAVEPWDRFVTTYGSDYQPLSQCHLQVNQLKPRTEAKAAPACIDTPQTNCETWPIFHQYYYKTTNSIYGSSGWLQPPSCSLFPAILTPFGTLAPSFSEASGVVGSALTEGRTQEVGVPSETRPLLGEEEKGQLYYVFGGKVNVLEQQETKEPQPKFGVLYEEGMILLTSHVSPACYEDLLRSVCREARLQHLLHLPVAFSPIITITDAENWDDSGHLRGFRPAIGLRDSAFLQPTSRQSSCYAWKTECPNSCFKMQAIPPGIPSGSTLPLAHVPPTDCCTEPSRNPWLTEYQASYSAEWGKPKIQQSDLHHHHTLRHQILYPSL
ncbi:uncharacterized protein LOC118338029 [Morone saxatilis]|uniref:uncharacterized protein LOC118338029 n=1 Tax=Morone saxatilis TaxID=34816 RepID=UPI0015E25520|nr:uncharacterized protein LOC118338029 [Morone saxatilis]